MEPPDVIGCTDLKSRLVKWHPPMTAVENPEVPIRRPNPVCQKEIGEPDCGYCIYTVHDEELFIGEKPEHQFKGKPWSTLKLTSVMLPAVESYAPMKAFFINTCKEFGECNKDIARWRVKLDSLDSVGDALGSP